MSYKMHHYIRLQSGEKEIIILTMRLEFVLDDDNLQVWLIGANNI